MRAQQQFLLAHPSGIKHPPRDNFLYTRVQMFLPFRCWEDVLCICDLLFWLMLYIPELLRAKIENLFL